MHFYKLLSLAILFFNVTLSYTRDYTGNAMLEILGKSVYSTEVKQLKTIWELNRNYLNRDNCIRLGILEKSETVDTILINVIDNLDAYKQNKQLYPYALPSSVSVSTLAGIFKVVPDTTQGKLLFVIAGYTLHVVYKEDTVVESYCWIRNDVKSYTLVNNVRTGYNPVTSPGEADVKKEGRVEDFVSLYGANARYEGMSTFKKSVIQVFDSWVASNFRDIKGPLRNAPNFWNYKYAYSTPVKIPGEKYSMLYSFPFDNSPLDYVSVLYESDAYELTFNTLYKQYESLLTKNFTPEEGWVMACIPHKDKTKPADLELRNDRFGVIVLDYTTNPRGRHALYLRFLHFTD